MDKADNHPMRAYLAVALAVVILYFGFRLFVPFFVPLFWGAVLGMLFYPVYGRLNRLLGNRATLSSALLTVAVLVLVLIPAVALSIQLVDEAINLFQKAKHTLGGKPTFFEADSAVSRYLWPLVERSGLTSDDLRQAVSFTVQKVGGMLVNVGSNVIGNVVGLVINIVLTLVALYYAFKDGPVLLDRLKELMPLPRGEVEHIVARLYDVIRASVFSTFAVAAAQGLAGGLVFWGLGLPNPSLWGVVMGAASLIPVAGAPVVWVPWAIYLVVVGDYLRAAALVLAGAVFVGSIDNLLRPMLIHGRVHIHNFYLFFGILGGVYLMGFTGILLGPILVSLSLTVLRIYQERRDAQAPIRAEEGAS